MGRTLRSIAEDWCANCSAPSDGKIVVCESHQECENCGQQASWLLCNEHYEELTNSECEECSDEATNKYCDYHTPDSRCEMCGDDATTHLCSDHNNVECDECGDSAGYHFCYSHNPANNTSTAECELCSSDATNLFCSYHYDIALKNEKDDWKEGLRQELKDELRKEIEAELRLQIRSELGLESSNSKDNTVTDTAASILTVRDENGDRRKISSSEFSRLATELGYSLNVWPESAGIKTRNVDVDGYSFRAELIANIARNEFGLRWPDEVTSDEPTISANDKSLIERLLQKEQLMRFMKLRNAFLSAPTSSVDSIPTDVRDALEAYQEITNLMQRFGAVPLKNEIMDTMAASNVIADSLPNSIN